MTTVHAEPAAMAMPAESVAVAVRAGSGVLPVSRGDQKVAFERVRVPEGRQLPLPPAPVDSGHGPDDDRSHEDDDPGR